MIATPKANRVVRQPKASMKIADIGAMITPPALLPARAMPIIPPSVRVEPQPDELARAEERPPTGP